MGIATKDLLPPSKTVWMWHLGTWFSRHGGVGLEVGLDGLRGLFQPYWFYDSLSRRKFLDTAL